MSDFIQTFSFDDSLSSGRANVHSDLVLAGPKIFEKGANTQTLTSSFDDSIKFRLGAALG